MIFRKPTSYRRLVGNEAWLPVSGAGAVADLRRRQPYFCPDAMSRLCAFALQRGIVTDFADPVITS